MKKGEIQVSKPCWVLKYCPYGDFVEQAPLSSEVDPLIDEGCSIFGHVCPVFFKAEAFIDEGGFE